MKTPFFSHTLQEHILWKEGEQMGKDNHNSSSNNKNSLPQTPKALKQTPQQAREEFSREFTELSNKNRNAGKSTDQQGRNKR